MDIADTSFVRPNIDITTNAAVRYDATDAAGTVDATNTAGIPEEAALTLSFAYDASLLRATLRFSQRLFLQGRRLKSPFYVFLPAEHIRQIQHVDTVQDTICGDAYQLRIVLGRPPELIGPPWDWEGRNPHDQEQVRKLQALAGATKFSFLIPTRALGIHEVTRFCEAAATGTLQSDPKLLRVDSLYSGKGGRKYDVPYSGDVPHPGVVSPPAYAHDTSAPKSGEALPAYHPHAAPASPYGPARTPPAAAEASRDKRPRSSSSDDSSVDGRRKIPCIGSSPLSAHEKRRLLRLHARLEALHTRLSSNAVDSTLDIRSQIKQMHEHLREWLDVSEAKSADELESLQDTVLELQSMVDALGDELGDVNIRIDDLDGACSLEAMESIGTMQEWVKDYVQDSVSELMDQAIARAFRNHLVDGQATIALLHNLMEDITVAAGHLSEPDHLLPPPADSLLSDATTVSDTATSPHPPATADDGKQPPVPRAERQTKALESIASASHRMAAALERIAQACEVSPNMGGAVADEKQQKSRSTSPASSLVFNFKTGGAAAKERQEELRKTSPGRRLC